MRWDFAFGFRDKLRPMRWPLLVSALLWGCAPPANPEPEPVDQSDDDDDDGDESEGEDEGSDPSTTAMGSSDGGLATTMMLEEESSSSTGDGVDENLDREAPNILDKEGLCGYPGPGQFGYGGIIDQSRFPNFVLRDCNGEEREFAEWFCRRDDEYGDYNHAFVITFEAEW